MGRPIRNSRIRSIKPEFWTDVKILDLSDSCALFFISLWNFCDDEGKIKNDPRQIAVLTRRFTPKNVVHWTSLLIKNGLLMSSECKKWLRVTGWGHQCINRPTQPDTKLADIKWNDAEYFTEESLSLSDLSCCIGLDRIGKDSIGEKTHTTTIEIENSKTETSPIETRSPDPNTGKKRTKTTDSFDQINQLKSLWFETVKALAPGVTTLPIQTDVDIGRLLQKYGYDQTRLAIIGARFEVRSENFNPSDHISLYRLFKPNLFEKFVMLGQQPTRMNTVDQKKRLNTDKLMALEQGVQE